MESVFEIVQLTVSKRPTLLDNETILITAKDVGIYLGNERQHKYDSGLFYVTSHRCIWVDSLASAQEGLSLPMSRIVQYDSSIGFITSSPKLVLTVLSIPTNASKLSSNHQSMQNRSSYVSYTKWKCEICEEMNEPDALKCALCGVAPAKQIQSSTSPSNGLSVQHSSSIPCEICTFLNSPSRTKCEMCGVPLPQGKSPSSALQSLSIQSPSNSTRSGNMIVKFSFRSGSSLESYKFLKDAWDAKAWEKVSTQNSAISSQFISNSSPMGGVSAIIKSVEQNQKQMDEDVGTAFSDLKALMDKASEMVKLAESITAKIGTNTQDSPEMATFQLYLKELGIASPVTQKNAGDMYTQELSRQLAEFLSKLLSSDNYNGVVSMVDLYCLFNRARGVALISPDDLYRACAEFDNLKIPFSLRRFDSGLLIVQSSSFSDDVASNRISRRLEQAAQGLSVLQLSKLENISVLLAKEFLLIMERRGLACRDETVEGLIFYKNLFI